MSAEVMDVQVAPANGAPAASQPLRRVSFVLPVYNEAGNLVELHQKLTRAMSEIDIDYELVFVDDGSTDESLVELTQLHQQDRHVRVCVLRRNFGKAAAYSAGFESVRGDVVITMDTDLQDNPVDVPAFLAALRDGADLVCGWKHNGKGPVEKAIPSKIFNAVVRRMTGIPLHDFNCPFKAYRRRVLQEVEIYGELHRYIPVLAAARGFRIAEVKVENLPRTRGQSKFGFERYLRGFLDLFTVILITRFARRPLHLFGLGGVLVGGLGCGIIGVLVAGHLLWECGLTADPAWNLHPRPLLTLGGLMMLVGFQIFSLGLLGELLVMIGSRRRPQHGYSIERELDHCD